MRSSQRRSRRLVGLAPSWCLVAACTAAPRPAIEPAKSKPESVEPIPPDPCVGREPWHHDFSGVLAKARCLAEVRVIMQDVADALGVGCTHCHQAADYAATTHNKLVANWMARDLAASLRKREGAGAVWCGDCHEASGEGVAKILGDPRGTSLAVEWMTAHLTATLERSSGEPLFCATCHEQTWGTEGFVGRVIPFEQRGNSLARQPSHDVESRSEPDGEAEQAPSQSEDKN